jgi:hypothetical protein
MSFILNPITAFGSALRNRNATQTAQDGQGKAFTSIRDVYALRRGYYESAAYDMTTMGAGTLKAIDGVQRQIREVLPLAKPAIDWWRGNLYPGTWTSDGRPSNSGKPNRIPWEADTPDELVMAAQQAFTWGNWQSQILVWSFFGPMYGDVFAEVEVDFERQKVYPIVHDPSYVTFLSFNRSGDITEYLIEIPQWDGEANRTYLWGKRVTKDWITTYYDKSERGFNGQESRIPNPYRFVPAVWVMHRDVGGDHGAPVIDGLYKLINELNGVQSAIDDFIMKFIDQQIIVSSDDPATLSTILEAARKAGPTSELVDPRASRETLKILPAPANASAFRVLDSLGLGEAAVHIDRLMKAVERNLPEVIIEEKLANLTQVTGPGARAIVAPAQRKLDEAVGAYDHGVVKLGQMCVSIMGELVNSGQFGLRSQLTEQQQLFLPFTLQSWDRGELSQLSISPRSLVESTMLEKAQEAAAVEILSDEWSLEHVGLSSAEIHGTKPDGTPIEHQGSVGILVERQARMDAAVANF